MKRPLIHQGDEAPVSTVQRKLNELGIYLQHTSVQDRKTNQERLLKISVWTEEEINSIEESRQSFGGIKPAEW